VIYVAIFIFKVSATFQTIQKSIGETNYEIFYS